VNAAKSPLPGLSNSRVNGWATRDLRLSANVTYSTHTIVSFLANAPQST